MASLEDDLRKLSAIPDAVIREEYRKIARRKFIEHMARSFVVPIALMEVRLDGQGPYLPSTRQEPPHDR